MKKQITPPQWLVKKRIEKARRRRDRRLPRLLRYYANRAERLKRFGTQGKPAILLDAPSLFGLLKTESHEALVGFLRRLVRFTLVDERIVCIDFSQTKKVYSDGTLLLYAEIERILARKPGSIRCFPPRDKVVLQVLCHLGILSKLGYARSVPSTRADVTHWQVFSGTLADATQGVGEAIESLPRLGQPLISTLFRSVSEALTNVTQHAHEEPRQDGTGIDGERSWWLFVRQESDQLAVVFCDLGLGVPYTVPIMPKHKVWYREAVVDALGAIGVTTHRDGQIIQATVKEKRSRFKLEHRGNGFGNMVETIDAAQRGRLTIHSNRGCYTYSLKNRKEKSMSYNYKDSIFGTVVGWSIALPEQAA